MRELLVWRWSGAVVEFLSLWLLISPVDQQDWWLVCKSVMSVLVCLLGGRCADARPSHFVLSYCGVLVCLGGFIGEESSIHFMFLPVDCENLVDSFGGCASATPCQW